MKLFDAHCQLQFPEYDVDRLEVLARMQAKGMGAVVVGTDYEMSKAALALANQHDFLWATVGLHPNADGEWLDISSQMEELAHDPKVVAIGECGLDYFRSGGTDEEKQKQKEKFLAQIALAQKLQKPLMVHGRNAHDDMLETLTEQKLSMSVIMHFFTATGELAQKYLDLGCHLSFPGPVTYTAMYDDSIRVCPMDKMLIETDAPYAAPVPFRGKRNEPAYVEHVAAKIAAVKGISAEEVAAQTILNAQRIFGLAE